MRSALRRSALRRYAPLRSAPRRSMQSCAQPRPQTGPSTPFSRRPGHDPAGGARHPDCASGDTSMRTATGRDETRCCDAPTAPRRHRASLEDLVEDPASHAAQASAATRSARRRGISTGAFTTRPPRREVQRVAPHHRWSPRERRVRRGVGVEGEGSRRGSAPRACRPPARSRRPPRRGAAVSSARQCPPRTGAPSARSACTGPPARRARARRSSRPGVRRTRSRSPVRREGGVDPRAVAARPRRRRRR